MAAGDVVFSASNIAGGARLTYQPTPGNEIVLTSVFSQAAIGVAPDYSPRVDLELYNGVIFSIIATNNIAPLYWSFLKVYLTNAIYARVLNNAGAAADIAICGMETK